ncbi:MAG: DUF928 domain-containing protein [Coleofasciculus sp. C1-SOL-03]|jgi:hypothetical protein|uniref:DUF928 domain-containing protein n=1 Tax=Coleofasciculus sp. C1-SOL-03 TaxID=3069522 RepID=UPI0032F0A18D
MACFTRLSHLTFLTIALTLGLTTKLVAQVPTQVRATSLGAELPTQWEFRTPDSSTQKPIPVNREAGGTRGPEECIPQNQSPIALVPESLIGKTLEKYPKLFWYMPPTTASAVEFVLKDANEEEVYRVNYSLDQLATGETQMPRIMSLAIPTSAHLTPLKTNQLYYWQLVLVCDPLERSADIVVGGGIKRVEPSLTLKMRIQQATPQERVALYAKELLWYDTLETLVELHRDFPNDRNVQTAWNKLLRSVGLQSVSEQLSPNRSAALTESLSNSGASSVE